MKKIVVTLAIIIFLTLGGRQTAAEQANMQQSIYIPIIVKAIESDQWNLFREGAESAASDYNVQISFEGTQRGAEVQEQLDMIEEALSKNPQAMVLSALDSAAVRPYLESAQATGIPVIGVDSGVDSPIVRTTVATDNYEAGALAAEKMGQLLGGRGKVGVITLDITSKVGRDRADGFVNTMLLKYPDIEVLPVQYGDGSFAMSKETAEHMLCDHPDLTGMFGGNEDSSIGITEAARELNREDEVAIIGFDIGQVAQAIREGRIAGAIAQNSKEMGYRAVETAYLAYLGQRLPEFINTGFAWYDITNIDTPEIQQLIYE